MTIEDDKFDVMVEMLEEFRKMSKHLENIGSAISDVELQLQDLVNEVKDKK
jgi:DNA anti-recombination protein RmuC